MPVEDRDELIRSLDALPVAAILTELHNHTFIAVNRHAAALFGTKVDELIGSDVLARIHPVDREAARTAYAAMADKVIDGYQVRRRIVTPDGSEVTVNISGRRIDDPADPLGLWVLIPVSDPVTELEMLMMETSGVILAVTDHDWQIEYMSSDAELIGAKGSQLRDFPLLGLVHPTVAPQFLAAAAQTSVDHVAITLLTKLRAGKGRWEDRYCLLAPMCEHHPPRLGVVISAGPSGTPPGPSGVLLDEQARHCALDVQTMKALDTLPTLTRLAKGRELSARQTEIVARLIAGQRPGEVARSMFLSPSTVRNHLSAIYRKFDVHSEAELLATLLRSTTSDHED